jgi:hypothetical protein
VGEALGDLFGGRCERRRWNDVWHRFLAAIEEGDQLAIPEALLHAARAETHASSSALAATFPSRVRWRRLSLESPPDSAAGARVAQRLVRWLDAERLRAAGGADLPFLRRSVAIVALAPPVRGAEGFWRDVLTQAPRPIRRHAALWLRMRARARPLTRSLSALVEEATPS